MLENAQEIEWSMPMIGWLLWNLTLIRDMYNRMEPGITAKYVDVPLTINTGSSCKVVKVAIERAAVSSVLDAVDRSVKQMHPEQRKIYRMKYRAGMTHKEIMNKLHVSDRTLYRRLTSIKTIVARELSMVPGDYTKEFWEKIDYWENNS